MTPTTQENDSFRLPYSMLSIVAAMVLQTFAAGWWASSMNAKIDFLQSQVTSLSKNSSVSTDDHYQILDIEKRLLKAENTIDSMKIK